MRRRLRAPQTAAVHAPSSLTRRPEASATPQRVQCPIVLRLAARRDVQSCRARRNRQPDRAAIPSVDHLRSEVTQRPRRHRIDVSHHETTGAGLHLNRCGLGPASALPLPSGRLRVRNHGAVVGAPVAPRVVSASAALEMRRMLIACGCRDHSVRTPITESIPTAVGGGESKRVSGKSPADSRSRSQNHHRRT